jgi:hypothetical protein
MGHAALRMRGLAILEDIAHTSKRFDKRLPPMAVYLPPQAIDVDIDNICVRLDAHSPHLIEDHGPGYDPSRISA